MMLPEYLTEGFWPECMRGSIRFVRQGERIFFNAL